MVKPFTKVLVGTDFSDGAIRAMERSADVAERYGARLHFVHVWELPHVATSLVIDPGIEWHTPVETATREQRDALLETLRANHVEADSTLLSKVAWDQIVFRTATLLHGITESLEEARVAQTDKSSRDHRPGRFIARGRNPRIGRDTWAVIGSPRPAGRIRRSRTARPPPVP